jgi:hypothetical protein
VILELEAVSVDAAGRRFDLVGDRAIDARPVWPSILQDLFKLNTRRFDSGGREGGSVAKGGGTAWKPLSPRTLAIKAAKHQDPRILHRTRALRNAATRPDAPHQVVRMDPQQLLLSTDLPYAGIVNKRRPIFSVPPKVGESMARKLLRFLDEGVTA